MNKRQIGSAMESIAANYLEKQGYTILERNYRCKLGEIDLIGMDGSYYVFIEVKFRKDASFGEPFEAVDVKKQKRIRKACSWYLMEKRLVDVPVRFDVVGILGEDITLLKNAF
ncbi:MAG: YraN family protein [Lachnospiraceae bacterium]